jgi:uncharacterized membrane protein
MVCQPLAFAFSQEIIMSYMNSGASLAVAAVAVVMAGAATTPVIASHHAAKIHCYGVNTCKGTSDCKSYGHECKGQNECKGQGFKELSKHACLKMGGKLTEK